MIRTHHAARRFLVVVTASTVLLGLTSSAVVAKGKPKTTKKRATATTTKKAASTKPSARQTTNTVGGQAKGTIKLGMIYASINAASGAATTKEDQKIAQAWAETIEAAGGINGYDVKVIFRDYAGDTARAVQAVRELEKAGVMAIVGSGISGAYGAVMPHLNSKSLPWIGGISSFDESRYDPMYFLTSSTNTALRYGAVATTHDVGGSSFFGVQCTESPACSTGIPTYRYAGTRESVKTNFQTASAVAVDYTPQCLAAKSAGADVLQSNGVNFANLVRDCQRQNYHPVFANGGSVNQAIVDAAKGEQVAGALAEMPIFYNGPEIQPLKRALAKTDLLSSNQTPPTQTSVATWLGFEMAKVVINKLTQPRPTRQEFLDALYTVKGETLGGMSPPMDYTVQRQTTGRHAVIDCWFQYIVKDGQLWIMNRSGQAVTKLSYVCGTGLTFNNSNPVPGGLEPFVS